MKFLFHLGHPAHFHLFKNVILGLKEKGFPVFIIIKKKDILEDLLVESGLDFQNILPGGRSNSKIGLLLGIVKQTYKLMLFCKKNKPKILLGSTPSIAHVGKIFKIPAINFSEDDANAVRLFAIITYPFSSIILSPASCDNGKWNYKTIKYNSYHELAYLHPNHFNPQIEVVNKYIATRNPFFLIRFSGLNAYHDDGISGINTTTAIKIIEILKDHGTILITSEKPLPDVLEKYRININPLDIHHFLAYAKMYIGDSQTMAAEAGVLGTPFIRVNDFVGRLGYLNEIEKKYRLGYGIKPNNIDSIFKKINKILENPYSKKEWHCRRRMMLQDKIDFASYLLKYISTYNR